MAHVLKRFVEWGIALRSNLFTWARIKLSVLYLGIIVFILALFTAVIFVIFEDQRQESFEQHLEGENIFVEEILEEIYASVFVVDGIIFVLSAVMSYILAGYTLKPIKNAIDLQSAFMADASHELRTPLTIIRTNTEVMLKVFQKSPQSLEHLLNVNLEEIVSMSSLAENLLTLSRGEIFDQVNCRPVVVGDLISDVIKKLAPVAARKQISCIFKLDANGVVVGIPESLERLFKNILINSINYTPQKGTITVLVTKDQKYINVSITDTGIGIPEKDIPHIFERFYKVDAARTETTTGSGLGLAIVKQIVDQHRGTVTLSSVLGEGTKVIVRLPVDN